MIGECMRELTEHRAYALLESRLRRVELDYVILSCGEAKGGPEVHRQGVEEAFRILNRRFGGDGFCADLRPERMEGVQIGVEELLAPPPTDYDAQKRRRVRCDTPPVPLPYWYAFLSPPHGTPYGSADFVAFHEVLFPHRDNLEIFRWNDGFSDYFDAGKEWWGTGLWSVLDRTAGVLVVIGASLTD